MIVGLRVRDRAKLIGTCIHPTAHKKEPRRDGHVWILRQAPYAPHFDTARAPLFFGTMPSDLLG